MTILKRVLENVGFSDERIWLRWISASEGRLFADTVTEMVDRLKELGPNPVHKIWVA